MRRLLAPAVLLTTFAIAAFAADPPAAAPPATPPPADAPTTPPPPPPPPAGKKTYALDLKKSSIVIQVFKDGAAQALAHDHVVEAKEFQGSISADAADPTTATVEVTAQTGSFVNDDPKLRKKYGLDGEISEKDRKSVEENMKSKEQLDTAGFPTVKFVSTAVKKGADGKLTLTGKLTLHGQTKEVSMPLEAKVDEAHVDGKASFRVKTSDYGIKPYSALLGAVKNKDEIVIHLHLVGTSK